MTPDPDDFPKTGRLLGLDYGTRRVGAAVSNDEQTIASPLETIVRGSDEQLVQRLRQLIEDYSVVALVVGLPLHMGGEEGVQARNAREFGRRAAEATGLPLAFHDERLTTARAEEHLLAANLTSKKRRQRRDMLAAQMMLQSYLDRNVRTAHSP